MMLGALALAVFLVLGVAHEQAEAQAEAGPRVPPVVPNAVLGPFRHGTLVVKIGRSFELPPSPAAATHTHAGVDLAADCGSPIFALADGVVSDVISTDKDRHFLTLGFMVLLQLDHGINGRPSYALHLHMVGPPKVRVGTRVFGGQTLIGRVGTTGSADGCHTHFEVRHFPTRLFENDRWNSPWNIYGRGDQRAVPHFREAWEDPLRLPVGTARIKSDSGTRVYPQPVELGFTNTGEEIGSETCGTHPSRLRAAFEVKPGTLVEVLQFAKRCSGYSSVPVHVRVPGSGEGFMSSHSLESLNMLNDEGEFGALSIPGTHCEGDPECLLEFQVGQYVRFVMKFPHSRYVREAMSAVTGLCDGVAAGYAELSKPDGGLMRSMYSEVGYARYRALGRDYLAARAAEYRQYAEELRRVLQKR